MVFINDCCHAFSLLPALYSQGLMDRSMLLSASPAGEQARSFAFSRYLMHAHYLIHACDGQNEDKREMFPGPGLYTSVCFEQFLGGPEYDIAQKRKYNERL